MIYNYSRFASNAKFLLCLLSTPNLIEFDRIIRLFIFIKISKSEDYHDNVIRIERRKDTTADLDQIESSDVDIVDSATTGSEASPRVSNHNQDTLPSNIGLGTE